MKQKILLVDDNLDVLDIAEVYLYREFDVFTAGNGFEALKMANEILPALVITDIMMPVMDGIKLFNDLRASAKTAKIPVIAMTSFVKKITKKSLVSMGFNGVLSKPINREKMMTLVASLLTMPHLTADLQVTDETTA